MSRLHTLIGAAVIALSPTAAAASEADMSFAIHDVSVSSNIPALNISVRNLAASRLPANRNLRVTSPKPMLNVSGQVWCKSFNAAHTRAASARVLFGNAHVVSSPDGADVYPIGTWSPSPMVNLGADEMLRNYSINAPVDFPDHWTGGFTLGFNPVKVVEDRMKQFVENGAGSEADFLRVDDVFETTITMNAVGWCEYKSQNIDGRYAGVRRIEVPVHIFYHGDPDIEDTTAVVESSGTLQAPPPPPGPAYAPAQGQEGAPPSRRRSPSREPAADDRRPPQGETAALLVPAIQRVREYAPPPASEGGVFVASGDVDGDGAAERHTQDSRPEASEGRGSDLGAVVLREGVRAVAGWLLNSRQDADRPAARPRGATGRSAGTTSRRTPNR